MGRNLTSSGTSSLIPAAALGLLGVRGPMTRSELAAELGVSTVTITSVVRQLITHHMVVEKDLVDNRKGGRPAHAITLSGGRGKLVGVKVAPSHITLIKADLDGAVIETRTELFTSDSVGQLDRMVDCIKSFVGTDDDCLGVGVGIPGSVDSPDSGIVDSPTIGLRHAPVGEALRVAINLPVFVENDVDSLAVAEQVYGIGRENSNYMVITIGRGIGCGIVIDDEIFRGSTGGAGEIGHIPVVDDGPLCANGHRGCLDSLIGSAGLLSRAREYGYEIPEVSGNPIDSQMEAVAMLARQAESDQELAKDLFGWAGHYLGTVMAGAVNLLDPQIVVILGEGVAQWSLWRESFNEAFRGKLIEAKKSVPCHVGSWDDDKWALGAAALVISALFSRETSGGEQGKIVRNRLGIIADQSFQ